MVLPLAVGALVGATLLVSTSSAAAQDGDHNMKMNMPGADQSMPGMPGMDHHPPGMESHSLIDSLLQHSTSGTDAEPASTPVSMLMTTKGNWTFMFHGEALLNDVQQ